MKRHPFDPDAMAVVTLALASVLLLSLPLFAHEVPVIKADIAAEERETAAIKGGARDRIASEGDRATLLPLTDVQTPDASGDRVVASPRLSIRIHTSTAMPREAFEALLTDIDRFQAVLPVSFVVRGLPVRHIANGLAATDHDRLMSFVEPLARRNIALDVDPTVGRALDRAARAAFSEDTPDGHPLSTLPAVEVRVNGIPLETHVGTTHVLAVLSRILRPLDDDPEALDHARVLEKVFADPAYALLKARVLEVAP